MLQVKGISKSFNETPAVHDASFEVGSGEILALTGESGCGKSTVLRIIGGLETPDTGSIIWNDKDITRLAPEKRKFGFVFQNLSLFPHLNVEKNILFSIPKKHQSKRQLQELLAMTGLTGLERRYPHELSGGQQQRTALARALAIDPKLLILDEPFSSLDELIKAKIRDEIFDLLHQLGITTVLVSHQVNDSFLIADQLVVMKDGEILQQGKPTDVYQKPKSAYISDFFGASVLIEGEKTSLGASTSFGTLRLEGLPNRFNLCIRPENITICEEKIANLSGVVQKKVFKGPHDVLSIKSVNSEESFSFETERTTHATGDTIFLSVPEDKVLIFE